MTSNPLLANALEYAEAGHSVIPLNPKGKTPCFAWKTYQAQHATQQQLAEWWAQWPNANIGLVTGKISNTVVVDIDMPEKLQHVLSFAPTDAIVQTGSGGYHLFYKYPSGHGRIFNKVGVEEGIDIRSDGGYVVAAGSIHPNGKQYQWYSEGEMGQVTPQLRKLLLGNVTKPVTVHPADSSEPIPEGQRNDFLFKKGCDFLRMRLDEKVIITLLLDANSQCCNPPLPDDEVLIIVKSVMTYDDHLPTIVTKDVQQRDVISQALDSLMLANERDLHLFQLGPKPVRLLKGENPQLEELEQKRLAWELSHSASWKSAGCRPPNDLLKALLGSSSWKFPKIKGIVKTPVFSKEGVLITTPGYNPETAYWYHNDLPEDLGEIVSTPSREEVSACCSLLIEHLLGEFPFKDQASLAHTIAAILLPLVRPMVQGPTPLHLIDAPTPGSGKTLLAAVISIIVLGEEVPMMAEANRKEEWHKLITARLMQAPSIIIIDNVKQNLDSGALSLAITSAAWVDRILGHSKTATLPVETMWLATGNNVGVSSEMARRVVWIRIVPEEEKPWLRDGFAHPDLEKWTKDNRGDLLKAALTIIQGWVASGCPMGTKTLGKFESWAAVMGGILSYAEIDGFLDNIDAFYEKADEEMDAWRPFVMAWQEEFQGQEVTAKELYKLANSKELLLEEIMGRDENTRKIALSKALTKKVDCNIDGYFIRNYKKDRSKTKLYCLEVAQ